MSAAFGVEARCERASISAGPSKLWASIRVDPKGKGLESERAPLAVALVIDVSGSMQGDPIAHVLASCDIVASLLDARDQLAIVTFSDRAGVRCGLTPCDDDGRRFIAHSLLNIHAGGGTNMHAGMEAAAGILAAASPGLRRTMLVLGDGQPNQGIASPGELARFATSLRPIGVSTLGFGLHHDEKVLTAIANAASGRYAYVPDPMLARVDLARAALAHGGIVAEGLTLELRPSEGVELLGLLPATQLRHGGAGIKAAIGDVFVDEFRLVAVELAIDLPPSAKGRLADIVVAGRAPDGAAFEQAVTLVVDVHGGPHAIDRVAQREILLVRADAARGEARAHADRGAAPSAASLLRAAMAQIAASEGFVRNDGSALAEMYEQLDDEVTCYERKASDAERMHRRKSAMVYTPTVTPTMGRKQADLAPAYLVGLSRGVEGQRLQLRAETTIGRSRDNDLPIDAAELSRRHARITYLDGRFVFTDLASAGGSEINGLRTGPAAIELADGDVVRMGNLAFRFELKTP